jgi:hypothetical protein
MQSKGGYIEVAFRDDPGGIDEVLVFGCASHGSAIEVRG